MVPLTVDLVNADGTPFGLVANGVTVPGNVQFWFKVLPGGTPFQGAGTIADAGVTDDNRLTYALTAGDANPQIASVDADRVEVQVRTVNGSGAQNTFPVAKRYLLAFENDLDQ